MGPKLLTERALAIEAVENRGQFFFGNTWPFIFDGDENRAAVMSRRQPDFAQRCAERYRVPDNVEKHLGQPRFDSSHDKLALTLADCEDQMRRFIRPGRLMDIRQGLEIGR